MDMRNVCKLVSIYSMLDSADFDRDRVKNIGFKVFGGEEEFDTTFEEIISKWGDLDNEFVETLFLELLEECYTAIKADLEADTLKEKENAS